jgi:phage FluMu protein Com
MKMDTQNFLLVRCPVCKQGLARVDPATAGEIEIECPRCTKVDGKGRRRVYRVIKLPVENRTALEYSARGR